jgi:hypothetical protein
MIVRQGFGVGELGVIIGVRGNRDF